MLIAQITDLHLGFGADAPDEPNRQRLDQLVAHLAMLDRRPDLLFVTGDLVEHGDHASYLRLRAALAGIDIPVHLCLGNHDTRDVFRTVFADTPTDAAGFVQYVVETPVLRCIVLDTLEEGRHGGTFCEARAAWLTARLAEERVRPTMIVLHHPPFETGIDWLTTPADAPWVARLRAALQRADNVVGLIAGHIHRPLMTAWAGIPCIVCPSAAPQVALTLAPLDPHAPDGRAMIVDSPPGLALHWWSGDALVSHFADTSRPTVLARFDARMQPGVAEMMDERAA